jgi:periplasmic protein TonB
LIQNKNYKKPTFAFYSTIISFLIYSLFILIFIFVNNIFFDQKLKKINSKHEIVRKEKINLKQFIEEKKIEKKKIEKKKIENNNQQVKNKNPNDIPYIKNEKIKFNNEIKNSYGEKFYKLSENQQKFIITNLEIIKKITKDTLERDTFNKIPDNITGKERNTIEFYFNVDGSISNLRFLNISNHKILEDITEETIKLSYKKYPKPKEETLIRFTISYNL